MIKLVTSNINKYKGFDGILKSNGIELIITDKIIDELQTSDCIASINFKSKQALKIFGEPVVVDDFNLLIPCLNSFPGPITKIILDKIGLDGIKRLVNDDFAEATIKCFLGITINENSFYWEGSVNGYLDFTLLDSTGLPQRVTDIFISNSTSKSCFSFREDAINLLISDLPRIQVASELFNLKKINSHCSIKSCPFCIEFRNIEESIFRRLIKNNELETRIIFEDDQFAIIVPLGQFVEGSLLLMPKRHVHSLSLLSIEEFNALKILLKKTCDIIACEYGVTPLVFEHGPSIKNKKSNCCVDHAHLNIFPVDINLDDLLPFKFSELPDISHVVNFNSSSYDYILLQKNGITRVYFKEKFDSQLVRNKIAKFLGINDRWNWLSYIGKEEMLRTYSRLKCHFENNGC